jgi:hypothetical protein
MAIVAIETRMIMPTILTAVKTRPESTLFLRKGVGVWVADAVEDEADPEAARAVLLANTTEVIVIR